MNKSSLKTQFALDQFEFSDVWPSHDQTPVLELGEGQLDEGSTYLSFPLTPEQRAFLGKTSATYIRFQVKKVS